MVLPLAGIVGMLRIGHPAVLGGPVASGQWPEELQWDALRRAV
jgi:hypothetical protein